jgi:hypothetical protein
LPTDSGSLALWYFAAAEKDSTDRNAQAIKDDKHVTVIVIVFLGLVPKQV